MAVTEMARQTEEMHRHARETARQARNKEHLRILMHRATDIKTEINRLNIRIDAHHNKLNQYDDAAICTAPTVTSGWTQERWEAKC
jgi:hypothetical protein